MVKIATFIIMAGMIAFFFEIISIFILNKINTTGFDVLRLPLDILILGMAIFTLSVTIALGKLLTDK